MDRRIEELTQNGGYIRGLKEVVGVVGQGIFSIGEGLSGMGKKVDDREIMKMKEEMKKDDKL